VFLSCIFKVNHFYLPTNALNSKKLRKLNSNCINILNITPLSEIIKIGNTVFTVRLKIFSFMNIFGYLNVAT